MGKNKMKDRVAGYRSGYKKNLDKISKSMKLGNKFDNLSKSQQKKVEKKYKKELPNELVQPGNVNNYSLLRKKIIKIPINKPKSKRGRTKKDTDWVKAGHDSADRKRKSEGLSNPQGKKDSYDVMMVYSKRKGFSRPTCFCCKNTDWKFLAFDHITKRPKSHKKISGVALARRLRNDHYPKGIQILCHNCNTGKEIFGGIKCPHHLSKKALEILKEVRLPRGRILKK